MSNIGTIYIAPDHDLDGFVGMKRAHDDDVGYDLFVDTNYSILPGATRLLGHNLKVHLPPDTWARVVGRSSAVARGLMVMEGVIDNGYRGPIFARVWNRSDEHVVIPKGERIAQLIVLPMLTPGIEVVPELAGSERGEGGFGSTGK